MSQRDKLIAKILSKHLNLWFEDLQKALTLIGYFMDQPRGGSSHYTFRKPCCAPITIPKKKQPIDKVYVELVAEDVRAYFAKGGDSK